MNIVIGIKRTANLTIEPAKYDVLMHLRNRSFRRRFNRADNKQCLLDGRPFLAILCAFHCSKRKTITDSSAKQNARALAIHANKSSKNLICFPRIDCRGSHRIFGILIVH